MLSPGKFSVIPVCVLSHSVVSDSVTPWTIAHQIHLSMELSRQELRRRFAISSSRGSSQPRDRSCVFYIAGRFFTWWAVREALCYSYRYLKLILRACWDKGSNEGNKMGRGTNEPLSKTFVLSIAAATGINSFHTLLPDLSVTSVIFNGWLPTPALTKVYSPLM